MVSTLTTSTHIILEVLAHEVKQEKKIKGYSLEIKKHESTFVSDITYINNQNIYKNASTINKWIQQIHRIRDWHKNNSFSYIAATNSWKLKFNHVCHCLIAWNQEIFRNKSNKICVKYKILITQTWLKEMKVLNNREICYFTHHKT